jgi:hypothetical protein
MYPDGTSFPVIERDDWWSDSWDAMSYGRDFDFSRPFFEQFFELRDCVPHPSLCTASNSDNCAYVNHTGWSKNCYFTFNTGGNRDCMYVETCENSVDCIECTRSPNCELCYDCVECHRSYQLQSSSGCEDCRESYFLLDCRACESCFACANLRRAKFCIFNRQVSEAEYQQFVQSIDLSRYSLREGYRKKAHELFLNLPHPHLLGSRVENVTGNYLYQCRNVFDSYAVRGSEDMRYCLSIDVGAKNCYDVSIWGHDLQLAYECVCCGGDAFNLLFCYECWLGAADLLYCGFCNGCAHCFGCIGLRKKRYCIFNKQYSEDHYFALVARIITHMQQTGEWGEFFPARYSHVPINTTLVQRYLPITRQEAADQGLWWYDRKDVPRSTAIPAEALPDGLPDNDSALEVIGLGGTRTFLIGSAELRMLRKLGAPLPRLSYDTRMEERQKRVAGLFLYPRTCPKSGKQILCSYPPSSSWIVWDKDTFDSEFNS